MTRYVYFASVSSQTFKNARTFNSNGHTGKPTKQTLCLKVRNYGIISLLLFFLLLLLLLAIN